MTTQAPSFRPINKFDPKKLPEGLNAPVAQYYCDINWSNGYEKWQLVRFATPGDGNCLFHAILNSFFVPYHEEKLEGVNISRQQIVTTFRQELSEKLSSPINDSPNAITYYDSLNEGHTQKFSQDVAEFSLSYMKQQLNSYFPIGYGYMEFIGNILNKDIYILEAIRADIYITDDLHLTIKGNRPSIVLYYINGHYELIGIRDEATFHTHFSPEHNFIKFLYERVTKYINS